MKFTININQKAIVDLGLQDKLDFIDLAIYDFITEFMLCEDCQKMIVGNEQYFWIKADLVIENMPLLGITTTRGVNKRIEKLIECNLLERCPENKNLRQSFFKVGKLYKEYKFLTWNESSKPSWNENSKSNNTMYKDTIDNNNNIDNIEKQKQKFSDKLVPYVEKYGAEMIQEFYDYWTETDGKGKMRFQKQEVFEISRRLARWAKNNKNKNQLYGTRTQSEKLRDTVIHANEYSKMLHDRVEQQATMGDGDSEEIRRLQDIL